MLVVDVGDALLECADLLLEEGFEVGFVLAECDSCEFLVLGALLVGDHHPEVLPGCYGVYLRWLLRDCRSFSMISSTCPCLSL